jgi:hypothetical protein
MQEPPIGAIENGREHMRRLLEHYDLVFHDGALRDYPDFQQLQQCFEVMAEWIETEADGFAGIRKDLAEIMAS